MRALRALVLTAGLGTRLRPLSYIRAKGAVPVNGEPLARRVAAWLASKGIRDLIFNLHHHPETIAAVLGDGDDLGVRLRYSWENPVLGSGGGPRHALPLLTEGGATRFLIVNGDTLSDIDLGAMMAQHERNGALVTMALIRNPAPEKYGGVLTSGEYVTRFTRRGAHPESYHFIGVQVVEARVFDRFPDGVAFESVATVYPALIKENTRSVGAFVRDASFRDIGTPADYLRTSVELAAIEGDRLISKNARVDGSAVVERSAIWDDVAVSAGARLIDCVVADGVVIPSGAVFERFAIIPAQGRQPKDDERIEGALLVRPL